MKLQIAMEYLIIVGVVLVFLIPIWVYVTVSQNEALGDLSLSYARTAVEKLRSAADMVYSQGAPAKVRQNVYFPSGLEEAALQGSSVVLTVRTYAGLSNVSAVCKGNLTGALPQEEGNYLFTVEAIDHTVSITYAT